MPELVQDNIMPLMVTKRMLGLAEKDPLGCAFGLTKDKKECVLLIQKTGSGKKAVKKIKADGGPTIDVGTIRFGRVQIHKDDPGTVNFTVNRSEAGGTIMALNRLVKKAGYQALVINADETLENESEDDETEAAAPDPAAMKAKLTELVKRLPAVIAADPARKDALLALAKHAQLMLGTNNFRTAAAEIGELGVELDKVPAAAPAGNGSASAGPVALSKSRMAWTAATQRVVADISKLRTALESHYGSAAPAVLSAYDKRVESVLTAFNQELADKLEEAMNAADEQTKQDRVAACKQILDIGKSVEAGQLITDLDDNPFVKLTIRATMGPTLTAVSAAIH